MLGSQISVATYDLCGAALRIQDIRPRAILPVLLIFKFSMQTYRFHGSIFTNVGHYILFVFIHFSPKLSLLPDGFLLPVIFSLHIYSIMFSASNALKISSFLIMILSKMHLAYSGKLPFHGPSPPSPNDPMHVGSSWDTPGLTSWTGTKSEEDQRIITPLSALRIHL